eukprot:COSAG06_NODE_30940_length_529_cov_2.444186_1_plen_60_part_10
MVGPTADDWYVDPTTPHNRLPSEIYHTTGYRVKSTATRWRLTTGGDEMTTDDEPAAPEDP